MSMLVRIALVIFALLNTVDCAKTEAIASAHAVKVVASAPRASTTPTLVKVVVQEWLRPYLRVYHVGYAPGLKPRPNNEIFVFVRKNDGSIAYIVRKAKYGEANPKPSHMARFLGESIVSSIPKKCVAVIRTHELRVRVLHKDDWKRVDAAVLSSLGQALHCTVSVKRITYPTPPPASSAVIRLLKVSPTIPRDPLQAAQETKALKSYSLTYKFNLVKAKVNGGEVQLAGIWKNVQKKECIEKVRRAAHTQPRALSTTSRVEGSTLFVTVYYDMAFDGKNIDARIRQELSKML